MINVAIIGLGRIGKMHGENLFFHNKFKIKYVYDIDQNLTKKISKKFNAIPISSPKIAFKDKSLDLVFITSSTPTHIKFIEEAAKNKKIIFCEKPLDLNIDKVNRCQKNIKKFNPKIQLGFNRRYDHGHSSIRKEYKKGTIGVLEKIIITSRDPSPPPLNYLKVSGGIFRDMMIHDFDLVRYYLQNDEIESVYATGSNISEKKFNKINDFELASCILKSKKGVQCIITNSRHCSFGYDQRVELFGTKGMLISGNKKENESEIHTKKNTAQKKPLLNFFIDRYVDAYKLQLDELAIYSKKKVSPVSSFEDGRRALIIANAAALSIKTKKLVKIKY